MICVGPTYSSGAGEPFTSTWTPPSSRGKGVEFAESSFAVNPLPKMVTRELGANPPEFLKLAALTTPA